MWQTPFERHVVAALALAGWVLLSLRPCLTHTSGGAILELSGTTGSGAAVGRAKGLRNKLNPNIKILDSQTGNFTRAEAVPVMQAFLKKYKPGRPRRG